MRYTSNMNAHQMIASVTGTRRRIVLSQVGLVRVVAEGAGKRGVRIVREWLNAAGQVDRWTLV